MRLLLERCPFSLTQKILRDLAREEPLEKPEPLGNLRANLVELPHLMRIQLLAERLGGWFETQGNIVLRIDAHFHIEIHDRAEIAPDGDDALGDLGGVISRSGGKRNRREKQRSERRGAASVTGEGW